MDAWGIPILRINAEYRDNEKKLWKDGREQAAVMLEAAGAKNVRLTGQESVPGFCIHEIGTARMGADPKTSVVNPYCQAHDVRTFRHRWRLLGIERLPESHPDHDGDYRSRLRIHCQGVCKMIVRPFLLIALSTLVHAETHRIVADRYYRTFSHRTRSSSASSPATWS